MVESRGEKDLLIFINNRIGRERKKKSEFKKLTVLLAADLNLFVQTFF